MKYKTWDGGEGEPDPRLVTSITVAQAFIEALPDYVEEPKMILTRQARSSSSGTMIMFYCSW